MKNISRGIFVVFEGIDGSGKTTLAHAVNHTLVTLAYTTLLTKEPGGSDLGKCIRTLLQSTTIISPKAEFLLFASDRAEHIEQVIKPALKKNYIVLSDRYIYSSVVYQGYGRNLPLSLINSVNKWVIDDVLPDIIFYIEIDAQTAHQRTDKRGNKTSFDNEPTIFFEKLLHAYSEVLKPAGNVITLDGTQTVEQLQKTALNHIINCIEHL